jgi:hypothetical protein
MAPEHLAALEVEHKPRVRRLAKAQGERVHAAEVHRCGVRHGLGDGRRLGDGCRLLSPRRRGHGRGGRRSAALSAERHPGRDAHRAERHGQRDQGDEQRDRPPAAPAALQHTAAPAPSHPAGW